MAEARQAKQKVTYADYCQWPDDERWELIDGVAYAMAAPSRKHQEFVVELSRQIGNFLVGNPCRVYVAPFDVRLPESGEVDDLVGTVVQPDVLVVCDSDKLDDKGCRGAPDWVIEVLSPSTALHDMDAKRWLYERHGVKEYWVIHPVDRWVMIYVLGEHGHPRMTGSMASVLLEGLEIELF